MKLHADFSKRVVVRPQDAPWVPSPMAGVDRKMLDRIGDEVARATSIVRYAPKSYFSAHTHGGGEEFLVLEGVFSDEHADYPAGSYVRNPIGTSHSPHSKDGCTIFVKLHQFDADDQRQFSVQTLTAEFDEMPGRGIAQLTLHTYGTEDVFLIRMQPGSSLPSYCAVGGEEMLVLDGGFSDEESAYEAGTWLRNPPGSFRNVTSETGCLLYVKTGHLAEIDV